MVYIGNDPGTIHSINTNEYLTTIGQTAFAPVYGDVVEVFYNGRLLSKNDWYLTTENILTLTQPADKTNDILIVKTWNRFTVVNTVTEENFQNALSNIYNKSEIDIKTSYLQNNIDISNQVALAIAPTYAQLVNTNTPVFANIPKSPLVGVLDISTAVNSIDSSIFEVDAINNLIKLYQPTMYTVISTIEIKSNIETAQEITFNLINNTTNVIISTQIVNISLPLGSINSYQLKNTVTIDAPIDIRMEVTSSETGFEFIKFNSTIISTANYTGTISEFEGALI